MEISAREALPSPPGRRELKKQVTRRELLLAGRELFSERGLYESRIEDVADRARVAKGTLYLYFRDKDDLILAVVEECFGALREGVEASAVRDATLRSGVERLVAGHLEVLAEEPERLRILHQARGLLLFRAGRWSNLLVAFERHLAWVADRLGEADGERLATRAHRLAMARTLFGSISGVASVLEATGHPLRGVRRRAELVPAITDLVLRSAWMSVVGRAKPRRGRRLPLRR